MTFETQYAGAILFVQAMISWSRRGGLALLTLLDLAYRWPSRISSAMLGSLDLLWEFLVPWVEVVALLWRGDICVTTEKDVWNEKSGAGQLENECVVRGLFMKITHFFMLNLFILVFGIGDGGVSTLDLIIRDGCGITARTKAIYYPVIRSISSDWP